MTDLVIDASIAAAWIIEDEHHPAADVVLETLETDQGIVPQIWHFEIRNVLVVSERRGRTTITHNQRHLDAINAMTIQTDQNPDLNATMQLARKHNLTFYDATYLELALRLDLPLATLDNALTRSAESEGVLWVRD